MVVADTNVIAALFIRTKLSDDALKLRARDALWCVDPFALIEFSNVLATYERARYLTKAVAMEQLRLAEDFLSSNYVRISNDISLEIAFRYQVTAYDARFLAVAEQVGDTFVIHMDRESLNDFPLGKYDVTVRVYEDVTAVVKVWVVRP